MVSPTSNNIAPPRRGPSKTAANDTTEEHESGLLGLTHMPANWREVRDVAAEFVDHRAYGLDAVATLAEKTARTVKHTRFQHLARRTRLNVIKVSREAELLSRRAETAAVLLYGLSAGLNSRASTAEGQVTEGVLATVGFKALGSIPGITLDLVMNAVGERLLGKEIDQKAGGYFSGHTVGTPSTLAVAYGEAFINGDLRALDQFAQRARDGRYGVIYQQALRLGDKVALPLSSLFTQAASFFSRP